MSEYFRQDDPRDLVAAHAMALEWAGALDAAFEYFRKITPPTWVENEANQILKRSFPAYKQLWEDAWEAIVAEERRKSREYEKWFHRNDKWDHNPNMWGKNGKN
jgi:hypothetical protein